MSVIEPWGKTQEGKEVVQAVIGIAQGLGVESYFSGDFHVLTKGTVEDGMWFWKKHYPKGIGCVWYFNGSRGANAAKKMLVFDFSPGHYDTVYGIAKKLAKQTGYDVRLHQYQWSYHFIPTKGM